MDQTEENNFVQELTSWLHEKIGDAKAEIKLYQDLERDDAIACINGKINAYEQTLWKIKKLKNFSD